MKIGKDARTVALRMTTGSSTGKQSIYYERLLVAAKRKGRFANIKSIRTGLGLTRVRMAAALRVSANTLKGWEAGKPIPEVAMTLAEVLNDFPAVRKKLMVAP